MKFNRLIITTFATLVLCACGNQSQQQVASNPQTQSEQTMLGQPQNTSCEPRLVNNEWLVPVGCNITNNSYYDGDTHTHNHYTTANAVAAGAVGVGAGIAGKMAYDKYKAKQAIQNTKVSTPNSPSNVAIKPNTSTPAPKTVSVSKPDLSKQKFTPSVTKPSYTSPSRTTTSTSKKRK